MEAFRFGSTGLYVSRLCYGTGPMGGPFNDVPDAEGARLLRYAFDRGVTFWDTAETYDTYRHVRLALQETERKSVVINTKTSARTAADGKDAVERALDELGTDYVDSMMLHAVEDPDDLVNRTGCLEALLRAQAEGRVRHVGASSHVYTGPVLEALAGAEEIEIVLCHLNMKGQGLEGGDFETHKGLIKRVYESGKAVQVMKVLDAGKVSAAEAEAWITWAFEYPYAHSVNLGMWKDDEIDVAVRIVDRIGPQSPAGVAA